jgi:hypothetical protein
VKHDGRVTLAVRTNRMLAALALAGILACGGGPPAPTFGTVGGLPGAKADAVTDNSGITAGHALVKFCNQVFRNGAKIDLTLEFGRPARARITASTNSCAPAAPAPCASVPAGTYPGRLYEGSTLRSQGAFRLSAGVQYLLSADINIETGALVPVIDGTLELDGCQRYNGPFADGGGFGFPTAPDAGVDAPGN